TALCLIEQRFPWKREVEPEEGWIPKARNRALGGGDPQEAGRGSLLGPVRKDKKAIDLIDIQSASVSAQTEETSAAQPLHKQR
ncbi:MAG: hypothetical protein IKQ87_04205, partial [Clostridia bacterium]|nr:hypothetical protein [Clostridia bacterium]